MGTGLPQKDWRLRKALLTEFLQTELAKLVQAVHLKEMLFLRPGEHKAHQTGQCYGGREQLVLAWAGTAPAQQCMWPPFLVMHCGDMVLLADACKRG